MSEATVIKKALLALTFSVTASTAVYAQELGFNIVSTRDISVNGPSCDKNSVHLINAGTDMSLLFDKMTVNLPAGGANRALLATANCYVNLDMKIPQGMYLTQSSSTIVGGVEKNQGASGSISTSMFLVRSATSPSPLFSAFGPYGLTLFTRKDYNALQKISDPLVALTATRTYGPLEKMAMCNWTKLRDVTIGMILQVAVTGIRGNHATQTAIVDLDSADTHFKIGMAIGKCK